MRRFSNIFFLTKNASSAFKYFTSTMLVTSLLLSLEPSALFAQTDPFAETKSPNANPFADVPTSDTNKHFQSKSETPSAAPASDSAAPASANPFGDPEGSDQKDNSVAAGSPTTTSGGVPSADSLLPNADNFEAFDPHEPEAKQPAAPKPSVDLSASPPTKSSKPQSAGWISWITDNLYLSIAIATLPLLLILGWVFKKRPKQADVQPRIKRGSFKKSDRFQESNKEKEISELGAIADESDSPSIPDAATALTGGAASIDDDDEFLDLMMDDSEEIDSTKLADSADELGDSALQESGAEVIQSVASDTSDDDDDDFLDLVMDDSEEIESTTLVDSADAVSYTHLTLPTIPLV